MNNLNKAAIGFLYLMIFSIFYSLFLLSISSLGFSALALFKFVKETPKYSFRKLSPFLALTLLFIIIFISGINSEDLSSWLRHLRLKAPFLFIPMAFYVYRSLIVRERDKLSLAFFILSIVSSFQIIYQVMDVDSMVALIKKGQAFATPVDHIKYSLYIAFSIILGFVFIVENRFSEVRWSKWFYAIGSLYLFIILHLLAVRSGLVVFYISMFFILIRYGIQSRSPVVLVLLVLLITSPIIAFKTFPTLNKKLEYMVYDFKMYQKGEGSNLSDAERLFSYKVGMDIFKSSPILGSGIGDLKEECRKRYKSIFNRELNKYPHNQFLFILAGCGIFGLVLFLVGMCYPVFYFRKKQDSEFLAIWLIFVVSFLVENTLERSYSISFFLLFLLGGMCKMNHSYSNEEIVSNPQSR